MTADFRFHTPIKVRYDETDRQGHVNFGHYLFYFDVGITEFMDSIGFGYKEMREEKTEFLFIEAHSTYESFAHWPEILNVHVRIGHVGKRSLRFEFQVRAQADDRLVASGHIVAVTAHSGSFELRPVPDRMREAIRGHHGEIPQDPSIS
jgi:acyl-CoA thioester hydrolase